MRKTIGKKFTMALVLTAAIAALSASAAFAAPVLKPGTTSAPGMSGTCTDCHTYSKPAAAPKPVLFSRPVLKKANYRRNVKFNAVGYFAPSLAGTDTATVTVTVERRNAHGRWVAAPSYNTVASLSATGKYVGKITYTSKVKIGRTGHYRLRAKLVYTGTDAAQHTAWSTRTNLVIRR